MAKEITLNDVMDGINKINCSMAEIEQRMNKNDVGISNIEIAHRIKNGDILVKFKDRPARDKVYEGKRLLKGYTTQDLGFEEKRYIFINESLSFDTRLLMKETMEKCKELGLKRIFTKHGEIKVKKGDRYIKIYKKEDIKKIN